MKLPQVINDNLRFLVVEVEGQLSTLQDYFEKDDPALAKKIIERRGYATNLKQRIHNACVEQLMTGSKIETLSLRAVEGIASNLERINDLCRNCIQQTAYLNDSTILDLSKFIPLLKRVIKGIQMIEKALQDNDTELALKIGRTEHKLDISYRKILKSYVSELKKSDNTEDLVSGLFVAHAIEQMGEVMLEISESILSSNFGQRLDMDRYFSLRESIEDLLEGRELADIEIATVAETKSGSGISAIKHNDDEEGETVAIFKDGAKKKLKEEKQGVESWHEIFPGLAPRIINYKKRGESAALLIEHLEGMTFEQIILQSSEELRQKSLKKLTKTLKKVWDETSNKKAVPAKHMQQMEKRLTDVFAIHPLFDNGVSNICGLKIPSFLDLAREAAQFEANLEIPFSVYIHGDFNVDNIIYDPAEEKIKFIDLHRSRYMDYVQDVSVFMVSNYRLQVFDTPVRQRIFNQVIDFCEFARSFAADNKDRTFEYRLGLGLARSLATSTRFILDSDMSRTMMMRARYLLEQIINQNPDKNKYQVPVEEIFSV